jgi:alpha-beta hydrolase superfamily lysophospholipase
MIRLATLLLWFLTLPALAQDQLSIPRADGASVPVLHWTAPPGAPLLILSHGLGGSEDGLSDLARAANADGFDVWAMGHRESGRPALAAVLTAENRRAMLIRTVTDPALNAARRADLDALLARIGPAFEQAPLRVYGGHSMGAQSVEAEAGAANSFGVTGADRFDAYVALSFHGPGPNFPDGDWEKLTKPILMVTGTSDNAITGTWETRLPTFADLPQGAATLAIIEGATHGQVSGSGPSDLASLSRTIVMDFLTGLMSSPRTRPQARQGAIITNK